jgi:formate dehydrogenase maturation protein FdhE
MPFANEEERKQYHKRYYEQNKHKGWNKHLSDESPERRSSRLAAMREYMLKSKFGITAEQYAQMMLEQNGKCAMCGSEPKSKAGRHSTVAALAVDHCHESGRVRRLLCTSCNMGLGWYELHKGKVHEYLSKNGQ